VPERARDGPFDPGVDAGVAASTSASSPRLFAPVRSPPLNAVFSVRFCCASTAKRASSTGRREGDGVHRPERDGTKWRACFFAGTEGWCWHQDPKIPKRFQATGTGSWDLGILSDRPPRTAFAGSKPAGALGLRPIMAASRVAP
jgi:hypothetical protein